MNEFNKILEETYLTRDEIISIYKDEFANNGYLDKNKKQHQQELERLKKKYPVMANPEYLMKFEMAKTLNEILPLIKEDYGDFISEDRLKSLENLANLDNIKVLNDKNDRHDFSAETETNELTINLAKLAEGKDMYEKIVSAKGILTHEAFHFAIKMLKDPKEADERIIVNLNNGEQIKNRGMVGFMLNEGFVEQTAIEFSEKHNLYYDISPAYIPYVNLCNHLTNQHPELKEEKFKLDYEGIFNKMNPKEVETYKDAECKSYAVRHKDIDRKDIKSTEVRKITLDKEKSALEALKEQVKQNKNVEKPNEEITNNKNK